MNSCKNYKTDNGDTTVIGGKLKFKTGATVEGLPTASATASGGVKAAAKGAGDTVEAKIGADGKLYVPPVAAATTAAIGGVKAATSQADSTATDVAGLVTDLNALLAKLRASGAMASAT